MCNHLKVVNLIANNNNSLSLVIVNGIHACMHAELCGVLVTAQIMVTASYSRT